MIYRGRTTGWRPTDLTNFEATLRSSGFEKVEEAPKKETLYQMAQRQHREMVDEAHAKRC